MLYIKGVLNQDKIRKWDDKDGVEQQSRYLRIGNDLGDYPVSINVPLDMAVAPIGEEVFIKVDYYPYHKDANGVRKTARKSIYVDAKKPYPKKEETDEHADEEKVEEDEENEDNQE